jgi:Predicted nucleotide kinase
VSTLKRLIFVTGPPGIGKTSVLLRSVNGLKNRGYEIGGMISRDVREGGVRVGFEIMDFSTGQRGWLAHVNQPTGPKISKYRVNLTDLEAIGVSSILDAIRNADIIIVDEIGPMELFSAGQHQDRARETRRGQCQCNQISFEAPHIDSRKGSHLH